MQVADDLMNETRFDISQIGDFPTTYQFVPGPAASLTVDRIAEVAQRGMAVNKFRLLFQFQKDVGAVHHVDSERIDGFCRRRKNR